MLLFELMLILFGVFPSEVVAVDDILEVVLDFLVPGVRGHVVSLRVALVDLPRAHDLVLGVIQELIPMG